MLNNFIYAKTKDLFTAQLLAGNVLDEAIVFIEDTKEIWNHGTYFDGSKVDLSNIETSILNILDTKLDSISDLETIRNGAALGATSVQPSDLATVAKTGSYDDLINKPDIPSEYVKMEDIPTKVSQLENDVPYITEDIVPNGVYAVDANGKLIDYNTADATATGVALVAGEHKFMIAKSDATNDGSNYNLYWTNNTSDLSLTNYSKADGTNSYGYLPKPDGTFGGSTHLSDDFTTWTNGALSDFNGKDNTEVIAAASSSSRDMCTVLNTFNQTEQTAGRSADWYVPSCGQLALMYLNITEINTALAKIGGTALADGYYWSSSENSSFGAWGVDFRDGYVNYFFKDKNTCRVRFIRDISVSKPLKERVSELENTSLKIYDAEWLNNLEWGTWEGSITKELFNEIYKYDAIKALDHIALLHYRADDSIVFVTALPEYDLYNLYFVFGEDFYAIEHLETRIVDCELFSIWLGNGYTGEHQEDFDRIINVHTLDLRCHIGDNDQSSLFYYKNFDDSNGLSKVIFTGSLEIDNVIKFYDLYITENTWELIEIKSKDNISELESSGAYAEVNHGTSDTTFTLTPNTFHVWDEVAALDLSFAEETAGVANEYLFQFTSGATATTLTLPDGLKWANDSAPAIAENMIYQVSVLNGLASVLEFSNAPEIVLITFYYNNSPYQAEEGMTWEEWCISEYNSTNLQISNGQLKVNGLYPVVNSSRIYVYGSDIITPYESYGIEQTGGGS